MFLLKDYVSEVDDLIYKMDSVYRDLCNENKVELIYSVNLSNFDISIEPKKCYRLDGRDIREMDILIGEWINLIDIGIESDYMGVLQSRKNKLIHGIVRIAPRFFYPYDKELKTQLIDANKKFDEYIDNKPVDIGVNVTYTIPKGLFRRLNQIYNNVRKGDFTHLDYLRSTMIEFKIFDQEKFYRAVEEGLRKV